MGRRVVVLFGGRSGEHEISVRSAATVVQGLRAAEFDVVPVGVTKDGRWWTTGDAYAALLTQSVTTLVSVPEDGAECHLESSPDGARLVVQGAPTSLRFDVVFPVLHGAYGEDGRLQGLLDMHDVAYVGSGVASSALCMDKIFSKRLLQDAGIPTCRWMATDTSREDAESLAGRVEAAVGFPCFIKPANSGSSVGISKVAHADGLADAIAEAAIHDHRVIIEEAIDAREIECGVIGNEQPEVSVFGELTPSREFYDYEDKYVGEGTQVTIPAELAPDIVTQLRTIAANAYRLLDCAGLARIDFFIDRTTDTIYLNEPNMMPGFTSGSMFPAMWEASGLPLAALMTRLVDLAERRHRSNRRQQGTGTPPAAANQ